MKNLPIGAPALLTLGLLWPPAPATAKSACGEAARTPTVGGWAEYATTRGDYRLAVVGSEVKGGATFYWMEISGAGEQGSGTSVVQVLIAGYPYQADGIQGMVVQMGAQPPVRMPEQMIARMRAQLDNSEAAGLIRDCDRWTQLGAESVTVGAGTLETMHLKDPETGNEVWVSSQVPFGLVKANTKASGSLTLAAYGSDAKSSLTGTPIDMPMPEQQ